MLHRLLAASPALLLFASPAFAMSGGIPDSFAPAMGWLFSVEFALLVTLGALGAAVARGNRTISTGKVAIFVLSVALVSLPIWASVAYAADAPSPVASPIPYGDWIVQLLAWARDILLALAGYVVTRWAPPFIKQFLTDQVLARAVDYAIALIDGVEKGRTATPGQLPALVTLAERYVVANSPALAARLSGTLRAKIMARLSAAGVVPAEGAAAAKAAAPLPAVPSGA